MPTPSQAPADPRRDQLEAALGELQAAQGEVLRSLLLGGLPPVLMSLLSLWGLRRQRAHARAVLASLEDPQPDPLVLAIDMVGNRLPPGTDLRISSDGRTVQAFDETGRPLGFADRALALAHDEELLGRFVAAIQADRDAGEAVDG